jgi:hypothetical protein
VVLYAMKQGTEGGVHFPLLLSRLHSSIIPYRRRHCAQSQKSALVRAAARIWVSRRPARDTVQHSKRDEGGEEQTTEYHMEFLL